jgi:CheY-like chemotaxis protein
MVMAVDDEATMLLLISLALKRLPCSVLTIDNPIEAIGLLESVTPDLFIIDLMMPQMNGFELCRYIRSNYMTADIPIILLSAQYDRDVVLEGLEAGATVYVPKSVLHVELSTHVAELLDLNNVPL